SIRKNAEERLRHHPRERGNGDDGAQQHVRRAQGRGEEGQQRRLAHLVGRTHDEVRQGDIDQVRSIFHRLMVHLSLRNFNNTASFSSSTPGWPATRLSASSACSNLPASLSSA